MTSYVEDALIKDERVVHVGRISLWSLWRYIVSGLVLLPAGLALWSLWGHAAAGVLLLLPAGLGLVFLTIAYVRYKTTELAITTRRVISKFGFVSRRTVELNIQKVESIQVEQSVMGRILDYGTLIISGGGNPQAPIPGISDPIAFRKAFIEAQDAPRGEAAAAERAR
jgi:uncharacterized membrane protein YdbT with pleckstrin-like domain